MSRSLGLTPTLAAGSGGHDKGAAGQPQKVVFDLHRPVVDEGILDAGADQEAAVAAAIAERDYRPGDHVTGCTLE